MLLTQMPHALQKPGRLGFVQPGVGRQPDNAQWHARFGQTDHYQGESNRYTGSWNPFYYSARTWHNDPTLKYQAPRPGSQAWYDETLVYQGERGPNQFGEAGDGVGEMSTAAKVAIALGASALIVGGAVLVVRHTLVEQGF